MTNGNHDKGKSDSTHFGHRRKSIIAVKPIDLSISFCHQSSFEAINFIIRSNLNDINSTTTYYLLPRRKRN